MLYGKIPKPARLLYKYAQETTDVYAIGQGGASPSTHHYSRNSEKPWIIGHYYSKPMNYRIKKRRDDWVNTSIFPGSSVILDTHRRTGPSAAILGIQDLPIALPTLPDLKNYRDNHLPFCHEWR